jgi:hypothetical protein
MNALTVECHLAQLRNLNRQFIQVMKLEVGMFNQVSRSIIEAHKTGVL